MEYLNKNNSILFYNKNIKRCYEDNLLYFCIEKVVISDTIGWRFIDVLHLIGILVLTTVLVEILLIVCMVTMIVFAVSNISTVIPCRYIFTSRKIDSIYFQTIGN